MVAVEGQGRLRRLTGVLQTVHGFQAASQGGEGVGAPGRLLDGVGDRRHVRIRTLDLAHDQHHQRGTAGIAWPEGVGPAQAFKAFLQALQFLEHGAEGDQVSKLSGSRLRASLKASAAFS